MATPGPPLDPQPESRPHARAAEPEGDREPGRAPEPTPARAPEPTPAPPPAPVVTAQIDDDLTVTHDVTEPLPAGTALCDSEQRLRALTAASADMLALYDLDGNYLEASPAARTLFGWEPAQLVGRSSYDLFHSDDLDVIGAAHQAVLAEGEAGPVLYRLRCADGSYRWVEVLGRAVRAADSEQIIAIQCTTREVTARHEAALARDALETRLRTTIRFAPIGMAVIGLDGRVLEVNDAVCQILQRPASELIGGAIGAVTHPDDLDTDLALLGEVLTGTRSHYAIDKRYLRPDGSVVPCELHVSAVRDEHGDPIAVIRQILDVTAREEATTQLRSANEALLRSNAELERFAAVASHDLRGPLHTARGLLDLLGTRVALPEGSLEAAVFDRAGRQLERLAATVDGLLDLALLGNHRLVWGEVPLGDLLTEVLEALELDTDCPPGDVRLTADVQLTGDPRLLHVLLQNLISNALRSAEDDRAVTVEVAGHRDAGGWELTVEDDGDGVPLTLRDQLFRPFRTARTRAEAPGHGLGLATCQRIVERHGGTINVTHKPAGTVFRVTVPTNAVERPPDHASSTGWAPTTST